ncbi:MAG: ABC transporter permease [Cypionkella sp.]
MLSYALRRLAQLVVVLLVTSVAIFSMTALLPGDPTVTMLGEASTMDQRQALRESMRLDDPLPVRYVAWLGSALQGDLGRSIRTQEPVTQMLVNRIPVTLELTFLSLTLAMLLGIPLGIVAARWRGTNIDLTVGVLAMSAMAMPFFWLGTMLIMLFAVNLRWLPPSGFSPLLSDPVVNLRLMVLPVLTVGMSMAAIIMRQTRSSMLDVLSQDYIRTARAKGLPERQVVLSHALRNAMNPVVTVAGLQFGALMGGAVVTETIFSLPGLGRMIVNGIFDRDFPVVQGAMLAIVLFVTIVNLVTDLLYIALDKRLTS